MFYHIISYYILLNYIVSYYIVLRYNILYHNILYHCFTCVTILLGFCCILLGLCFRRYPASWIRRSCGVAEACAVHDENEEVEGSWQRRQKSWVTWVKSHGWMRVYICLYHVYMFIYAYICLYVYIYIWFTMIFFCHFGWDYTEDLNGGWTTNIKKCWFPELSGYPKLAGVCLFHGKYPNQKWMMTAGSPHFRKPPNGLNSGTTNATRHHKAPMLEGLCHTFLLSYFARWESTFMGFLYVFGSALKAHMHLWDWTDCWFVLSAIFQWFNLGVT